jgi:hypothetical protein
MHRAAIVTDKQITCTDRGRQIAESSFAAQVCHLGSTERLDCCDGCVVFRSAEKHNLAINVLLKLPNQLRE